MSTKEIADPEIECLKLKKAINENHRLAQEAAADAVERAVLTGELLLQWKECLPHGKFEPFVEAHFDGTTRTARTYMEAAKLLNAIPNRKRASVLNHETSIAGLIGSLKSGQKSGNGKPGGESHSKPRETPRSSPVDEMESPPADHGKCPNCGGTKWTDQDGLACAKCHHPHGEPVGDVDKDRVSIQRSKTVKTVEALMRAFDDLNQMLPNERHRDAINNCKVLLNMAKGWK